MREERKKIAEQYRRYMEMEKTMVNTSYITSDGLLIEHALAVASHHIQTVAPATISDIFLY